MRLLISSKNFLYEYKENELLKLKEGSFWKKIGENYIYKNFYNGEDFFSFKGNIIDFSGDFFVVKKRYFQLYKKERLLRTFPFEVKNIEILEENIYSKQGDSRFNPGNILITSDEFVRVLDENLNTIYELTRRELGCGTILNGEMIKSGLKGEGHLRVVSKDNLKIMELNPITKIPYKTIDYKTLKLVEGINDYYFNVKNRVQILDFPEFILLVLNDLGKFMIFDHYFHFVEEIKVLSDPIDFVTTNFEGINEIKTSSYRQFVDIFGSKLEHENMRKLEKINKMGSNVIVPGEESDLKNGVIIYGSRNCVHCEGVLDMMSDAHEELDFKSYYMDLTEYELIRKEKNIKSYPTTVIIKNGMEVARFVGKLNYDDFLDKLEEE